MKIRNYIYCIAPGPDHDRLQSALLDRANALNCQCTRSVIGASLASGSAFLFEGIVPEPDECLSHEVEAGNRALEQLRAETLQPNRAKFIPDPDLPPPVQAMSNHEKFMQIVALLTHCETCKGTGKFSFECPACLSGQPGPCTCATDPPGVCPQCDGTGCYWASDKAKELFKEIKP